MSEGVVLSDDVKRWSSGEQAPTREEVLAELARELAKRRAVYPKWVAAGYLTPKMAMERIDRLQAAYDFVGEKWPATPKR